MTEAELILAAQQGDDDAFESLVRLYEKKVYALALRMCGNPDDAAEVAQEAFLSAWQGLKFFRRESTFSTWLYRLTSNASIDLLRKQKRPALSLEDEELNIDLPDCAPTPEEALERSALREEIERGLLSLSDDHRQVLVLREMHQLSYSEIADTLDVDVGTVKSRISRGRKHLRKVLLERGNFFAPQPSKEIEKEGCK
ncbi:sigma-70 family RNA polymerase sigma factor [Oscillibacter sp. MSJ-2]|uniref:Sigma-70 family RNA polymerase sigma factor n=1 Tax=Dysosmobacter acutus TaxID=2841504 RepID=A0ABS6F798_9FIRM|nr:sigma-70 family RNA polymerase sigma factor [Dysosmobacter acutus]MBU5626151.1 sigma-70 family RNA polymerase sigma factor [Dysosmobacter acutus]